MHDSVIHLGMLDFHADLQTRLRLWNLPTAPWPTAAALLISSLRLQLTAVPCSVVEPFLWPDLWSGTRYQTTYEIRRVLLTVYVVI